MQPMNQTGEADRPLFLTALPVFNEVNHVDGVLDAVTQHSPYVLVVDDGSSDGTSQRLQGRNDTFPVTEVSSNGGSDRGVDSCPPEPAPPGVAVLTHAVNRGYGGALASAFYYAVAQDFKWLVTIDCDGQHQPQLIGKFIETAETSDVDIVSGSRYLQAFEGDSLPPEQRRQVNASITAALNRNLGFHLTDAFCGFKAYRVESLKKLSVTEFGYGMPLELWVQAACHEMRVIELPVPRVYTQETRSFGEHLDDTERRLAYYRQVIERSLAALPCGCGSGGLASFDF